MSKKLTDYEIKKFAKQFGWSPNDAKDAVEEYRGFYSIIDQDDLIRKCISSQNPQLRVLQVTDLLYGTLKGSLDSILDELMNHDPMYNAIAVFNFYDIKSNPVFKTETELLADFEKETGSFIDFPISIVSKFRDKKVQGFFTSENILRNLTYPIYVKYEICDSFIRKYIERGNQYSERLEQLVNKLITKHNFELLNIPIINTFITEIKLSEYYTENQQKLYRFKELITGFDSDVNRNLVTNKRYIFYYCLIEKIKIKGYKTVPACKHAALLVNERPNTIRTRYYEIRDELKKEKQESLDELIYRYNFARELEKKLSDFDKTLINIQ